MRDITKLFGIFSNKDDVNCQRAYHKRQRKIIPENFIQLKFTYLLMEYRDILMIMTSDS